MNPAKVFVAMLVLVGIWAFYTEIKFRRKMRYLADEPGRDPYLERVRAMRNQPGGAARLRSLDPGSANG